ncbi:cartilage intermediate layer protein 1-like [Cololabis saira]|uniref:cartilage intermediate layer protein 1-like n=1 Tax=Cololabis saira TaxID=129043 RepID=UPI002AD3080B|nr:cartilage intermediate layer protein 1-like [Cololabis saira]
MIKLLSLAVVAVLVFDSVESTKKYAQRPLRPRMCWTNWYDRDNPSGTGDWETLTRLRQENPKKICSKPQRIQAVTADTLTPAHATGERFLIYSPRGGLVCRNQDQRSRFCRDYKVRFLCPCIRHFPIPIDMLEHVREIKKV